MTENLTCGIILVAVTEEVRIWRVILEVCPAAAHTAHGCLAVLKRAPGF